MRVLAVAGLAVAFAAGPGSSSSLAADPATGKVSSAAPKVTWKGQTTGGAFTGLSQIILSAAEQAAPCLAPSCDQFTLDVANSADLEVSATSATANITMVQIMLPDGSAVADNGQDDADSPTTTIKIPNAPVGVYKVQVAINELNGGDYSGAAQVLGVAAPPTSPTPTPTASPTATAAPAPPPATEQPAPAPQGGSRPATRITVVTGKTSAKRINRARKLVAKLSASSEVTNVKATLVAGRRAFASGRVAKLNGTRNLVLKLKRKLKPGKYTLRVSAKDGTGTVDASARLTVRR